MSDAEIFLTGLGAGVIVAGLVGVVLIYVLLGLMNGRPGE